MRVAIYGMHYSPEPSGNAPYTTSLARGLAERGHAVHVIAGTPHYPNWEIFDGHGQWKSQRHEGGVDVTRLRHFVSNRPTTISRSIMELTYGARISTRRLPNVDVAICVSPALLGTTLVAGPRRLTSAIPSLIWIQDLYSRGVVETQGEGIAARVALAAERYTISRFDHVVVAHDRFRSRMTHEFGVPHERTHVIRNWTRLGHREPSAYDDVRARFGWLPGEVICLHAGNLGTKQGLENVIDAARYARDRDARLRFVFIGNGNQEDRLRRLADGLTNVDFVGSLPDDLFEDALAAADILLVNERPGVMEMSIPSKLTSYFASGRPVVAAVGAGSVTEGELLRADAGVCVPPGDPGSLVEEAQKLAQDPQRAERLGTKGREFAHRELSESSAVQRFEALLTKLAESRSTVGV